MWIHHHSTTTSRRNNISKCLKYYYFVINVATTTTATAGGRLLSLSSSSSSSSLVSAAFLPSPKPTSSTKFRTLQQQQRYYPTNSITTTSSRRCFVTTATTATTKTSLLSSSSSSSDDSNNDNNKDDDQLLFDELPTAQGVVDAYELLTNKVVKTPLLESTLLNEQLNNKRRILIKAECLQTTGSFKYRGALNRLLKLKMENPKAAKRGVVAFSSGNFGQALAAAATTLDMECCIVSPHDAPTIKLDRIQKYGANLILSKAKKPEENREIIASALAQDIAKTKGMTLLHPFEDIDVIHGQGTVGMEILQQINELDVPRPRIDTIIVPCGGGGLTAGINLAVQLYNNNQQQTQNGNKKNKINVISVEPKGYDDHSKSFQLGQRKTLAELYPDGDHERSIDCDALMAGAPGIKTWSINSKFLTDAIESNGDKSASNAMKIAFEYFNIILEPSGSLGLAAVLDGQIPLTSNDDDECDDDDDDDDNSAIVVIASGGNTDLTTFARLMGCTNDNENE